MSNLQGTLQNCLWEISGLLADQQEKDASSQAAPGVPSDQGPEKKAEKDVEVILTPQKQ